MTAQAHPLLLKRLCNECGTAPPYWMVPKSKAKEAFLLVESDLRTLPSAQVPFPLPRAAYAGSTEYLLPQVAQAAVAKHGGPEGLRVAFHTKQFVAYENHKRVN